ncbi:DUF3035 domain-containing protein [Pelagibius litoralis]|uniref:DUF3035 domain-containing protein n=1 Tax=Pelagibius litoralis TaxID=374515 RepID=A0A967F160_9PROT|nr:DUF3035 domain-containing protein [Pelagibius litoralis]NIA71167.1 DUF3035 domain-containing protein [Pelagibius litoralis]
MTFRVVIVSSLLLGLSACGGFQEQLGLTKQSPDEFRVVSRAPLTVPPDFALRPPEPGAARPQEGTPAQQAERAVFRNAAGLPPAATQTAINPNRSAGEQSLLSAAGAQSAEPNIRLLVDRETKQINSESDRFVDALVFWNDQSPAGTIVDPQAELRRLQENAALGRPSTTGATPQIERRRRAPLEGIF